MAHQASKAHPGRASLQQTNSSEESKHSGSSEHTDGNHADGSASDSTPTALNATSGSEAKKPNSPANDSRRPKPLLRSSPPKENSHSKSANSKTAPASISASSSTSTLQSPRQNVIVGSGDLVNPANATNSRTNVFPELDDVETVRHRKLPVLPQTVNADSQRAEAPTTPRKQAVGLGDIIKNGPPPPKDAPPTSPRSVALPLANSVRQGTPPPPKDAPPMSPRSTALPLGSSVKQGTPPPQDPPPTTPRSSTQPSLSGMPPLPGSPGSRSSLPATARRSTRPTPTASPA